MCLNCFSLMMAMDEPGRYCCERPVSSAWQPNREVAGIGTITYSTPRLHHVPPPHSSISFSTPRPPPLHRIPTYGIAYNSPGEPMARGGALVETMTFNPRVVGSTPALAAT